MGKEAPETRSLSDSVRRTPDSGAKEAPRSPIDLRCPERVETPADWRSLRLLRNFFVSIAFPWKSFFSFCCSR